MKVQTFCRAAGDHGDDLLTADVYNTSDMIVPSFLRIGKEEAFTTYENNLVHIRSSLGGATALVSPSSPDRCGRSRGPRRCGRSTAGGSAILRFLPCVTIRSGLLGNHLEHLPFELSDGSCLWIQRVPRTGCGVAELLDRRSIRRRDLKGAGGRVSDLIRDPRAIR